MRNLKLKLMMLTVAAWSGAVLANEYRSPLITEHGPIRYDLWCKPDSWTFESWAIGHYRNADKAFLKHGTKVSSLPSFIFGQETFAIGQSFQGGLSGQISQFFFENKSPFLTTTQITPQATYTERGFSLGGRLEFPVWKHKGRIGLRGVIPFKSVRMERDDSGEDELDSSLNGAVVRSDTVNMVAARTPATAAIDAATSTTKNFFPISRYKLSLLTSLLRLTDAGTVVPAVIFGNATPTTILGTQYSAVAAEDTKSASIPFVVIKTPVSGLPPYQQPTGVAINRGDAFVGPNATADASIFDSASVSAEGVVRFGTADPALGNAYSVATTDADLDFLPADASTATSGVGYVFNPAVVNYTTLATSTGFNDLWVTPVFGLTTPGTGAALPSGVETPTPVAQAAINSIEQQLLAATLGVEEFLFVNGDGFQIATNQHTGIGDLDLDLFYEHTINDAWRAEVWLGARFPTGGSNNFGGNPLRVQEGNGNHFEIKLGANTGFECCDWLNMKLEAYYSFVLQGTEKRIGAFTGATIKNIGPTVSADVDWGYFDGRFDLTWYHPNYKKLSTTFGYEFYYKTKDNIRFKQASIQSFLGQVFGNSTTTNPAGVAVAIGPVAINGPAGEGFIAAPMTLDNNVAAMDTEGIAHRVRGETNWRVNCHMSLFAGGAFTFAGQYMPREYDMHGGINVRF